MPDPIPTIADLGVNPNVDTELLPHIDSFVKWEIVRFLNDNPFVEASVEDLARYVGRDETEVKPAARALVSAGVLRETEGDGGQSYALCEDESLRDMIADLVRGFVADRLIRLVISSHILTAQRRASRLKVA